MDELTRITYTAATADLRERIERLIVQAVADGAARSLFAATVKVGLDLRAEARSKGWTPTQVQALSLLTAQVGARLQRVTAN